MKAKINNKSQEGVLLVNIKSDLAVLFFLAVTAFLVYGNSLQSPFIWDDQYLILNNHFIRSFKSIFEIFKHHLYYSTAGLSNFYRPLQTLFLVFDYFLWGINFTGYHITSIIFHILTGFAAYLLVCSMFKRRKLAFVISLLFIVHPVNSIVVNYISSRADSQASFFIILSLLFFIKYVRKPNALLFYCGAIVSFILALLSKELAIVTPFLILSAIPIICSEDNSYKKSRYLKVVPIFIVLVIYVLLRSTILNFTAHVYKGPGLYIRLLTTCESFVRLILILFVPLKIHIEKSVPFSTGLFQPSTFISVLTLFIIGIFMYWIKSRSKKCFFGLTWFFVSLLPMAGIMPINATLADHWLYLPCIGFFLAIIGGVGDFIEKLRPAAKKLIERFAVGIYVSIIIVFIPLDIRQNAVWKDPLKFYKTVLEYSPNSFRAHNEMGVIYMDQNKLDMAIIEFQSALKNNPVFDQAYDNLGIAYDMSGDFEKAIQQHEKALKLNQNNPKVYNNLGNAYNNAGKFEEAIQAYQNALRLNPDYKAVYNNIGVIYYRSGDYKNAKIYWEKALEIDPGFTMASDNLKALDAKK